MFVSLRLSDVALFDTVRAFYATFARAFGTFYNKSMFSTQVAKQKHRRKRRDTVLRVTLPWNVAETARAWGVNPTEMAKACNGKPICETDRARIEAATGLSYNLLRQPVSELIGLLYTAAKDAGVFDE